MTQLAWPDIFTDASALDFARLLGLWPNTVSGPLRAIGASAFGDCFFERPSGQVERLDALEGGVHHVASTLDEFAQIMNSREWQTANLLTEGVALLLERGITRTQNQFFAFAPHPAFTGKIDWDRVMPMDAEIWHSICAQTLDTST